MKLRSGNLGRVFAYHQQTMMRHTGILLGVLLSGSLIVGCATTKPQADPFQQQSVDASETGTSSARVTAAPADTGVHTAAFTQSVPSTPVLESVPQPSAEPAAGSHQPLQIPSDLPGSEAPTIRLPPVDPRQPQPERLAEIERLFRALPELPAAMEPVEGAGRLSLAELQSMALQQNPVVRQAMADVQAARGAAIQAGAYRIQASPSRRIMSTRATLPAIRALASRRPFPPVANWHWRGRQRTSRCRTPN